MKKTLIKYSHDCGRMGSLDSTEVIDENELRLLDFAIEQGIEIYFGEVLGKHSEVICEINAYNVTVLSEDQEKIEWLLSIAGKHIGGNVHLMYEVKEKLEEDYDLKTLRPHSDND